MFLRVPAIVFAGVLALGQSAAAQDDGTAYQVRPGDRVTIEFYTAAGTRLAEVSGERTIDRNGRLYLPYVGTVSVEGLDAPAIRELLTERYSTYYDSPVVDVEVRLRVNVTGAVRLPGNFFMDPSSTIVDALSQGGGTGTEVDIGLVGGAADPTQVRLVRGGVTRVLNLRAGEASADVLNLRIQSGDWIYVPPRTRSRWRDNLQFVGSIVGILGTLVTIGVLLDRN